MHFLQDDTRICLRRAHGKRKENERHAGTRNTGHTLVALPTTWPGSQVQKHRGQKVYHGERWRPKQHACALLRRSFPNDDLPYSNALCPAQPHPNQNHPPARWRTRTQIRERHVGVRHFSARRFTPDKSAEPEQLLTMYIYMSVTAAPPPPPTAAVRGSNS